MGLSSVVGVDASSLGQRFLLVSYLPTASAVVVVALVVLAGAPGEPTWSSALVRARALDAADVALLVLAVTVLGVLLAPLQLALVRLLEGYGWDARCVRPVVAHLTGRQRRARARLVAAAALPPGTTVVPPEAAAADAQLRRRYPGERLLLPTALGNALRAFEHTAGRPYGLDAVVVWPRLYPLLPDGVRALVDDRRNQLDVAARSSATALLVTVITAVLLRDDGWWLLVPAAALVLSRLAYVSAVAAAVALGEAVRVALDLHRFTLLTALHLPLPADPAAERELGARLSTFLRQGVDPPPAYRHPD